MKFLLMACLFPPIRLWLTGIMNHPIKIVPKPQFSKSNVQNMTIFSQYLYKLISYYSKEPTKRRGPSKYKRWKVLKKK